MQQATVRLNQFKSIGFTSQFVTKFFIMKYLLWVITVLLLIAKSNQEADLEEDDDDKVTKNVNDPSAQSPAYPDSIPPATKLEQIEDPNKNTDIPVGNVDTSGVQPSQSKEGPDYSDKPPSSEATPQSSKPTQQTKSPSGMSDEVQQPKPLESSNPIEEPPLTEKTQQSPSKDQIDDLDTQRSPPPNEKSFPPDMETARVTLTYKCLKEDSKKCVIPEMSIADPSVIIALPNLVDKTTLQIKGGLMKRFTEELSDQLADIEKLQLGSLEMEELFLRPHLIEVEAIGNRLTAIILVPDAEYQVRILRLNGNALKRLDGFEAFTKLKELHLSSNALENIDMLIFDKMVNLERLYLDHNEILTIEAATSVKLPVLDKLTLAENALLGPLDVTNWDFESLTELDISWNNLTRIDGLAERFPSLINIHLAHNSWNCVLLDKMLNLIADSFVTVKDSDEECEGLSPANICCSAESDDSLAYDDSFHKLEELEGQHKALQQSYSDRIRKLASSQEAKLMDAKKRLYQLLGVDIGTSKNVTQDTLNKDHFVAIRNDVQSLTGTLDVEMKKLEKLKEEAAVTERRLRHSVAELRRGLRREAGKIGELQAQFALLKQYVGSKRS